MSFFLLLRKNLIISRRSIGWTIFEVLLPFLLGVPVLVSVMSMPKLSLGGFALFNDTPSLFMAYDMDEAEKLTCLPKVLLPDLDHRTTQLIYIDRKSVHAAEDFIKKTCVSTGNVIYDYVKNIPEMKSYYRTGGCTTLDFNTNLDLLEAVENLKDHSSNLTVIQYLNLTSPDYAIKIKEYEASTKKLAYEIVFVTNEVDANMAPTEEYTSGGKLVMGNNGEKYSPFGLRERLTNMKTLEAVLRDYDDNSIKLIAPPLLHDKEFQKNLFIKKATDQVFGSSGKKIALTRMDCMLKRPYPMMNVMPTAAVLCLLPLMLSTSSSVAAEMETGVWDFLLVMGLKPGMLWVSHGFYAFLKGVPMLIGATIGVAITLGGPYTVAFFLSMLSLLLATVLASLTLAAIFRTSGTCIKLSLFSTLLPIVMNLVSGGVFNMSFVSYALCAFPLVAASKLLAAIQIYDYRGHLDSAFSSSFADVDSPTLFMGLLVVGPLVLTAALIVSALVHAFPNISVTTMFRKFSYKLDEAPPQHDSWHEQINAKGKTADIETKGIVKMWESNGEMAVRGVDFVAYRGEVTVLLGHNGAGKSSTYAMLCGITPPTKGTIEICGEDLASNPSKCRRAMGFCPQGNCLFPKLTVDDHLWFYHSLKGGEGRWKDEADKLCQQFSMDRFRERLSTNISGGQKRKLSVALALIGGSKVILLDEPTAGMDPASRREMETVVEEIKQDRTIVLTTHYMDEAEALGDRITILHVGRIICSGTSHFLKQRFGVGYILSIVLNTNASRSPEEITAVVKKHVELTSASVTKGKQLDFEISRKQQKKLPNLLQDLEENKDKLQIDSFGVSLDTLEDVFIRVGEMADGEKDAKKDEKKMEVDSEVLDGFSLILSQMKWLLYKRLTNSISPNNVFWQLFIPMLFILLVVINGMSAVKTGDNNKVIADISLSRYKDFEFVIFTKDADVLQIGENLKKFIEKYYPEVKVRNTNNEKEIMSKKYPWTIGAIKIQGNDRLYVYPSYAVNADFAVLKMAIEFEHAFDFDFVNSSSTGELIADEKRAKTSVSMRFVEKQSEGFGLIGKLLAAVFEMLIFLLLAVGPMISFPIIEQTTKFKMQLFLAGLNPFVYWLSHFLYDFAYFSIFIVTVMITTAAMGSTMTIIGVGYLYFYVIPTVWLLYMFSLVLTTPTKAIILLDLSQVGLILLAIILYQVVLYFGPEIGFNYLVPLFPGAVGFVKEMMRDNEMIMDVYNAFIPLEHTRCFAIGAILTMIFALVVAVSEMQLVALLKIKHKECPDEEALIDDHDVHRERRNIDDNPQGLALKVHRLTKYYGKLCALKATSYGMRKGETFGLLGESGAGKTTTFSLLTCEQYASFGRASINDKAVEKGAYIGYCPQFDAVIPHFSGIDNLRVIAGVIGYKNVREKCAEMLKLVGLYQHRKKKSQAYSGGQRRRLSIAMSLMTRSDLIIMDEPTAGVDPRVRREIWAAMSLARSQGKGILLTSHSMEECEALCNRIAILCQGRLIAINSAQALKSRHGLVYVMVIVVAELDQKRQVIDEVAKIFPKAMLKGKDRVMSRTLKFHIPRYGEDQWASLFKDLQEIAEKFGLKEYCISQSTLEDTFLALNKKYFNAEHAAIAKQQAASLKPPKKAGKSAPLPVLEPIAAVTTTNRTSQATSNQTPQTPNASVPPTESSPPTPADNHYEALTQTDEQNAQDKSTQQRTRAAAAARSKSQRGASCRGAAVPRSELTALGGPPSASSPLLRDDEKTAANRSNKSKEENVRSRGTQ